jgi:ferrochelatase
MSTSRIAAGVLVVNVGTPQAPTASAVRRYLREFLSDPRVLDLPALARWMLVNLVILPTRPARSAEAYRKIWRPDGSPLLVHGRSLVEGLRRRLGPAFTVELGMRYGSPSMSVAMARLVEGGAGILVVFPLYPQYAASTMGSALARAYDLAARRWQVPAIRVVSPFFAAPAFLAAEVEAIRETFRDVAGEHLLFSFHGLPERHLRKSDATGARCLVSPDCCVPFRPENRHCYRAQCLETARLLAEGLRLPAGRWSVAFQSRLGRAPWIRPYTEERLRQLAREGVRRVAVSCPSFVADCLETEEEIGLRGRDVFLRAGGESFSLVPALNDRPTWLDAAADLVRGELARIGGLC